MLFRAAALMILLDKNNNLRERERMKKGLLNDGA